MVMGFPPELTATVVVSAEHTSLEPLLSVRSYGAVPPIMEIEAVTVADCPESMAEGDSPNVGTPSSGLTVTETVKERVLDPLELDTVPQYFVVEEGVTVKMYCGRSWPDFEPKTVDVESQLPLVVPYRAKA